MKRTLQTTQELYQRLNKLTKRDLASCLEDTTGEWGFDWTKEEYLDVIVFNLNEEYLESFIDNLCDYEGVTA